MTETHLQKQKEKQKQMVEYIASFINLNKVLWTPEYRQPVRKEAFFFSGGPQLSNLQAGCISWAVGVTNLGEASFRLQPAIHARTSHGLGLASIA